MKDKTDQLQALVERDRDHECDGFGEQHICVRVVSVADLPTRFGPFRAVAFWNTGTRRSTWPSFTGRSSAPATS